MMGRGIPLIFCKNTTNIPYLEQIYAILTKECLKSEDYPIRLHNNYWNKVFTADWQRKGVNVYPNVTWSLPDSYEYAVAGLPKGSVVAINSMGVLKYNFTKGLWLKGYRFMVDALQPILILRYGPKVQGEYEEISLYLPNVQLNIMRNGR